jgi:protein-L-isoaspartate(D-aspartate) O-methyltransferase
LDVESAIMIDKFKLLRESMVADQLVPRGISDKLVLDAMKKVPRHKFMPEELESSAYEDNALPIGEGQTISQPYMVAIMTEKLGLKGREKILEIGTGSGYQAAVLAEIAKKVYTIEYVPSLAEKAKKKFDDLGYKNIEVIVGDGTLGLPEKAPFNGIMVTAGAPSIPKTLTDQLAEGGRLVIPVGERFMQILTIVTKRGRKLDIEESIACVFVPLVGKYGWKE